eukprot:g42270.t1
MVHDRKVLSFVANRAQMLYKMVSEPPLGLTNVEEATSGATDAVDQADGCAGEPLSNVEGLLCALNGGYVEQSLFRCYTGTIPHLLLHHINDCIGAVLSSHEEFEQFINFMNTFHPNLKCTWTISHTSLSFLDLSVSISGDRLETDIY